LSLLEAAGAVMEDGLRTGVKSGRRELGAEFDDCIYQGLVDLVGDKRLRGGTSPLGQVWTAVAGGSSVSRKAVKAATLDGRSWSSGR
jgi:hypothetical protein